MPREDFGLLVATEAGLLVAVLDAIVLAFSFSVLAWEEAVGASKRELDEAVVVVFRRASDTVGVLERCPIAVLALTLGATAADDLSEALGFAVAEAAGFVVVVVFGATTTLGEASGVPPEDFFVVLEAGRERFFGAGLVAGGGMEEEAALVVEVVEVVAGLEDAGLVTAGLVTAGLIVADLVVADLVVAGLVVAGTVAFFSKTFLSSTGLTDFFSTTGALTVTFFSVVGLLEGGAVFGLSFED